MTDKTAQEPTARELEPFPLTDTSNRKLLRWLSDDGQRALLFKHLAQRGGRLAFPSRDSGHREADGVGPTTPRPPPEFGHRSVTLITKRSVIEEALRGDGSRFSNRAYAELGGGSFMLALDPVAGLAHKTQREAYAACFPRSETDIAEIAHLACEAASIMSLRAPEFDLALFAEQAAVRFCQKLLGYSLADFRLLETALRAGYRGLVYQVLGRHFTTDPLAIPEAKLLMGRLLARTSALIDAHADHDDDALKGTADASLPDGFEPVLRKLAFQDGPLNGEQRAVVAAGAALGTVGNVQAAACIAVKALFADPGTFRKARELALGADERGDRRTGRLAEWKELIRDFLSDNPPIPFVPRVELDGQGAVVGEVLLALGGATRSANLDREDPLIWGLPPEAPHHCAGQALAWPLLVEIVRHVMRLPGLAERLDPVDASVIGLEKRWGFVCESYPLTHRRDRRMSQSSLNVAMRLRSPVRDNADRVRDVIRAGAPRIEEALRASRHVHFAWFELIESDSVLVLHTVYDGPFSAYIQHFALRVGDLFDALFACIENPPPTPVDEFPNEFIAHIQRYDRPPATGYFFSAYPQLEVARIVRAAVRTEP